MYLTDNYTFSFTVVNITMMGLIALKNRWQCIEVIY